LGQLLIDNSYGYSTLLIQRGKEGILTAVACVAAGILALFAFVFHHLHLPFEFVAIAVVIAVLFYNFFVIYYGNKITKQFNSFFSLLIYIYKIELFAPVVLYIFLSFVIRGTYINIALSMSLYALLNYKDLKNIIKGSLVIISNEELLKIS